MTRDVYVSAGLANAHMWPISPCGLTLVILLCIAPLGRNAAAQQLSDEEEVAICHEIAVEFLANRQRLGDFVWEFTAMHGMADSIEAAGRLEITEEHTKQGAWAVRGEEVRFELLCPSIESERVKPTEKLEPGSWVGVECGSDRLLHDGQFRLSASAALGVANIAPEIQRRIVNTPFSLGGMGSEEEFSPGNEIMAAISGEGTVSYLGQVSRHGRTLDLVVVTRQITENTTTKRRFYIDRRRGSLPIETELINASTNESTGVTVIKDVQQSENGCYYPAVGYQLSFSGPPHRTWVYRTLALQQKTPNNEELALLIPEGTMVIDIRNMRRSFRLADSRSVKASEIEGLLAECRQAGELRDK